MKFHVDGNLPKNGEVFVFGSNLAGRHGAGAARAAMDHCGAIYGVGAGPTGNSYAIPTKDIFIRTMALSDIKPYIDSFLDYAEHNKYTEFFVSAIGCGLAGYTHKDIAPMFKDLPNVSYPEPWKQFIVENV